MAYYGVGVTMTLKGSGYALLNYGNSYASGNRAQDYVYVSLDGVEVDAAEGDTASRVAWFAFENNNVLRVYTSKSIIVINSLVFQCPSSESCYLIRAMLICFILAALFSVQGHLSLNNVQLVGATCGWRCSMGAKLVDVSDQTGKISYLPV